MVFESPDILIVAAMREELTELIHEEAAASPNAVSTVPPELSHCYWRPLRFRGVVGFCCYGVGKKRARKGLSLALDRLDPKEILVVGYSGALAPDCHPGDLVVVDKIFNWRKPVTHFRVSNADARRKLESYLMESGITWVSGAAVCVDRVIDSSREKERLRDRYHAICVDMESDYVFELIRKREIPVAMIRVISDTADESMGVDFGRIPGNAWARRCYFGTHPGQRRAFQEIMMQASRARRHLSHAVTGYLKSRISTDSSGKHSFSPIDR